jgi:type I restriction enzyme M protein
MTSHAIDQNRAYGIQFEAGLITNVTHEHLDYHKTYDNYVQAKTKLLLRSKIAIANHDDGSYPYIKAIMDKKEKPLTPDQRKKLMGNFEGYDIDPGMVRIAQVNMYLHQFKNPKIVNYDSLSMDERWGDKFDVILANPPFMSPKGGVSTHSKFSINSTRSEVLFVDYITNHLRPQGRAGIVVPNGIVATTQTAYKQLRKMLVQDSLIAVISLPAGVFQPYSGVKTSILILDKNLAKRSNHILFLKIDNDGFDLGAQRREIDKNDLPLALKTLETHTESLIKEKVFDELPKMATLVEKETILANKDIFLSAEKYFETEKAQTEFDLVKLEEVCIIQSGGTPSKTEKSYWDNGTIPWVGSTVCKNEVIYNAETLITELGLKKSNAKLFPKGTTLIALVGATIGKTAYLEFETTTNQNIAGLQVKDETVLNKKYLFLISQTLYDQFYALGDGGFRMASLSFIKELEIPLPPLKIQDQIVAEIEDYRKIIDGAKQIVNNYKPIITIKPDWEMVEMGEVCEIKNGRNQSNVVNPNGKYPIYGSGGIMGYADDYICEEGCTIIGRKGTINNPIYVETKFWNVDTAFGFSANEKINKRFLFFYCCGYNFKQHDTGTTIPSLTKSELLTIKIPLPSLEEQQTIVKAIEEEVQLVNSSKRLIEIFEQKIKSKIGEVWGVKEKMNTTNNLIS